MHSLRPDADVRKFLISTPSRFRGGYEGGDDLLITHAGLGMSGNIERAVMGESPGPFSRNYYVVAFRLPPTPRTPGRLEPLDPGTGTARAVCFSLCVLFGKRFDLHGPIECFGHYHVPDLENFRPLQFTSSGPYNHDPRPDLGIPLELAEFRRVERLFFDHGIDEHFRDTFFAAARFYHRSLLGFDTEPDVAYLDLTTCGEILAEFFEFPDEVLYGRDILDMLAKVKEIPGVGKQIAGTFKGRMRQVKLRFTRTVVDLLNDYFFTNTEAKGGHGRLDRVSDPHPGFKGARITIRQRIEEAYNVRSSYVHSGAEFGHLVGPRGQRSEETQFGWYAEGDNGLDRRLAKALSLAPTYLGLERIMRYCLVRFLHLNGVSIDPRLDGPPPPVPDPAEPAPPAGEPSEFVGPQ